jgi:hypothetical protein
MATAAGSGGHGSLLDGLSARFRDRRNVALRDFIARSRARRGRAGPFRIADLGGSFAYWERVGLDFLAAQDIVVTVINRSESELKLDRAGGERLTAEVGDACRLSHYADDSFDLVHSNSVVEHVGGYSDMQAFAAETRRLAPAYYVQTPYAWFPVDPHFPRLPFYHWLPVSLQLKLQRRFKLGWAGPARDVAHAMRHIEGTVLLDRTRMRDLFPDARHRFERVAGLPKSMIAERDGR